MIQIHIYPNKVEKVLFVASSESEEDQDLTVWHAIRALVTKIDKRLKKSALGNNSSERLGACDER
jgi:hypothetical protein